MNNPFERIDDADEESRQIEEVAKLMRQLLDKRHKKFGTLVRGVHPKSHGCLKAKFDIFNDIDQSLQIGLFSNPGASYESIVRYSNADSLVRKDLRGGENGSRGMAVKITGVPGDTFYTDGCQGEQDFLMINTSQFAFANIPDYLRLQQVLLHNNDEPAAFFAPLQMAPPTDPAGVAMIERLKRSFGVLGMIKEKAVANPLEIAYFGAAPFLFGDNRVMRVSVVPQVAPEQVVPADAGDNYLREAVKERISKIEDIVFDFKIQVRNAGEDDLYIEDATQSWSFEAHPPKTVARLTIPCPQSEPLDCEKEFFTPWHALKAHQPIGGINRLRRAAYIASAKHRGAKGH